MPSEGFVGCTLGCLAGGAFEPNAAMLCLLSCYLAEIHGSGEGSDDVGNDSGHDDSNGGSETADSS